MRTRGEGLAAPWSLGSQPAPPERARRESGTGHVLSASLMRPVARASCGPTAPVARLLHPERKSLAAEFTRRFLSLSFARTECDTMRKSIAFPTLTTRRLRLRRFQGRDLGVLHACFSDVETMRLWNFPAHQRLAETERVQAWLAKTTSPYDHLAWAVCRKTDEQLIGMVNYHARDARNRRLQLGYMVAPKQQGKGYGAEAVAAVLDYCCRLGVHRIEALVQPDNVASLRLLERLGFHCEGGPLRDYWRVGDRFASAMIYARIAG
jgi:[ribosomal protein S5]-alanine N-acetyltransferase